MIEYYFYTTYQVASQLNQNTRCVGQDQNSSIRTINEDLIGGIPTKAGLQL